MPSPVSVDYPTLAELLEDAESLKQRVVAIKAQLVPKHRQLNKLYRDWLLVTWYSTYLDYCVKVRNAVDRTILWRPGGVLIGAAITTGILFILTEYWILAVIGLIAGLLIFGILFYSPSDRNLATSRAVSEQSRIESANAYRSARAIVEPIEASLNDAEKQLNAKRAEIAAHQRTDSRRLRELFDSDWKSLRGVEFERFLKRVFRALGYSVQLTRVTGDQGVDLVLIMKKKRIAVQVKGYSEGNNVSNSAIQEVHAGMVYYDCDACCVITNSRFTSSAVELSRKVGCILIDEESLPQVILRQQNLWSLCFEGVGLNHG